MNYLAHFQLATLVSHTLNIPLGAQLSGAFLADHLTGNVSALRTDAANTDRQDYFWEAVQLHRRVDTLTDTHPAAIRLKAHFPEPYRRYAPVLIDIFFDVVLATHYREHHIPGSAADLGVFADSCYVALDQDQLHCPDNWPTHAMDAFSHMQSHNWLVRYATLRGIERTLAGIAQRLRRPLALTKTIPIFQRHLSAFEDSFAQLWPEIQAATINHCREHYPLP